MHIVIIGNGISGITAARHIRKLSRHQVTIISSESEQFFARTALMYVFMRQLTIRDITPYEPWFWKKNKINLLRGRVSRVDTSHRKVVLANGAEIQYDRLIIATGSRTAFPEIRGCDLTGVQGFYSIQDLNELEENARDSKQAVIIGGGLIGIELAEMLTSRGIKVHLVVREVNYYGNVLPEEESHLINEEIRRHGISLHLNTTVDTITGTERVTSVRTSQGDLISCDLVAIATGVKPNIEFLDGAGIEITTGVLVDHELRTNIPEILAIGDCAEVRSPQAGRRAIEPVWYTGRMMGELAAHNVCGYHIPYEPGYWFNSAKFFDIEYQVYGDIQPDRHEGISTFYWQHPVDRKCLRVNFNTTTRTVTGFNVLGMRLRQEVCEKWMRVHATIDAVMADLSLANFDPEFYRQHEPDIIAKFNADFGTSIHSLQRRSANATAKFLSY